MIYNNFQIVTFRYPKGGPGVLVLGQLGVNDEKREETRLSIQSLMMFLIKMNIYKIPE
jgi:hypothetical protein